uniref:Unplaced genomic scaffold supercont1.6, whole genome shotgun sequence n=1 Tax=Cryptococcus bacillisporus CA1280 TaxID=1296109 RepID=A0A0D0UJ65_CRYGA|nr:hypothetical protein I312_02720 [Cryptococcus bacillisporus CA1280]
MARHRERPHRRGHRTRRRKSYAHRWLGARLGGHCQRTGQPSVRHRTSQSTRHHIAGHTSLHLPFFLLRPSFPHCIRLWSCGFRRQRLSFRRVYKPPTTYIHTPTSNTPHIT